MGRPSRSRTVLRDAVRTDEKLQCVICHAAVSFNPPFCFASEFLFRFTSRVIGNLLMPELAEMIRRRDFNGLRELLCSFPAPDLAEIFVDLNPDDEAVLLRLLPRELAAEVFEYLPLEDQEKTLQALGSEHVAQILNDIAP